MPEFLSYGNLQPEAEVDRYRKIPIAKAYNQCTTQTRHFPLQCGTHPCNETTILRSQNHEVIKSGEGVKMPEPSLGLRVNK